MEALELLLRHVVDAAIICFEFVGVFVIILAGLKGIRDYVKKNPQIRLNLATGMALGLEFIVLRAALTFLIHWEIKVEKADEEELNENHH